ncbi:unnamed protein product [Cochlearia groenlandica]
MRSHTILLCMLMLSLVALHQCTRINVGEIDKSNKIVIDVCYHYTCTHWFKKDCWCCDTLVKDNCWINKEDCDYNCPKPPK